jgi:GxxExxY protein
MAETAPLSWVHTAFSPIRCGTPRAPPQTVLIELPTDKTIEQIIACAIEVHRELGPGLLESCYRRCLEKELHEGKAKVVSEIPVTVIYKAEKVDCGFRLDLVVNDLVVVEIKAVEHLMPVHSAQVLTYLRLANYQVGLLINFNKRMVKDGIKRLLNRVQAEGTPE